MYYFFPKCLEVHASEPILPWSLSFLLESYYKINFFNIFKEYSDYFFSSEFWQPVSLKSCQDYGHRIVRYFLLMILFMSVGSVVMTCHSLQILANGVFPLSSMVSLTSGLSTSLTFLKNWPWVSFIPTTAFLFSVSRSPALYCF